MRTTVSVSVLVFACLLCLGQLSPASADLLPTPKPTGSGHHEAHHSVIPDNHHAKSGEVSKVKLALYYESLCPFCQSFVTGELSKAMSHQDLASIIDLELVPYGNAFETKSADGTYCCQCQHGEEECRGNMAEACAIEQNKAKSFKFIECLESTEEVDTHARWHACADHAGLDGHELQKCAEGAQGKALHHKLAIKTESLRPRPEGVPHLVVNGQANDKLTERAFEDLVGLVCDLYKGPAPATCVDQKKEQAKASSNGGDKDNENSGGGGCGNEAEPAHANPKQKKHQPKPTLGCGN